LSTIINKVHCRSCGAVIAAEARACPQCGGVQAATGGVGQKNRIAAIVLALLLGGFGAHKFYLGKPIQGILCVLFFWTFIPALIAFVEVIIYAFTSDQDFAAKYG